MSKVTSQVRQRSKNENEMRRTWQAAEWLIRDKVEQLDHLLFKVHQEARTMGVETNYIVDYVQNRMNVLIDETAAKREEEERQGVRGRKRG
jgi:ribosome assembly protein YihI (activator of Der GTPase)